jgi:hypothetical protein
MKRNHLLLIACITLLLASCSIEKRVYQSGYYISGRHAANDVLDATKRVKPVVVEEAHTLETTSEEIVVATEEYTSSAKPLVSSDSTIEETITSNIHQTDKFLTETNADSIPDKGKILLAKYEKNHAAKNKIRKIGFYPLTVATFSFFMTWIIFLIYIFSSMPDRVFTVTLLIFAAAVILVIPFAIIYLILSIITKKQRRKLRRMGLVK